MTLLAILGFAISAWAGIGNTARDFEAKDINGNIHHLGDYKGKILILEFYDLDCPFCKFRYKSGAMQELQRELTAKGVVWLLVNSVGLTNASHRSAEAAKKEWASQKIAATAWLDDSSGEMAYWNGISRIPALRIIDKDGIMAYAGPIDDHPKPEGDPRKAHNFAREAVSAMLAGETVRNDNTGGADGCPFKRR